MIKQFTPTVAIVAALFASAAMSAAAQEPTAQQAGGSYNWLHPKLGMVKVDRATGAIVHSQGTADPSVQDDTRSVQTKYWLDPKGNYRVIRTVAAHTPQGSTAAIIAPAGAASAQILSGASTDEARALAGEQNAQRRYLATFVKPQLQAVAAGDYFADARNRTRVANYRALVSAVQSYGDGARSHPSGGFFMDELRAEQQIASAYALLQSSPQARADLAEGRQAKSATEPDRHPPVATGR